MLIAAVLMASGCASHWTLRTAEPAIALQWPYQPLKAKLTYVHSLTGLSEHGGSSSVLHSIVYGKDRGDRNAFVLPVAVATGADGRIAVADLGGRCVHLYLPAAQRYLRLLGSKDVTLASPVGVVFDDERNLWVSDSTGRLFVYGEGGELRFVITKAGEERLERPTGLAYSPARKLIFVVDTLANRVHAFTTKGEPAFSFGSRGETEGSFNFPTHIFRSRAGELYVTDALNFRIEIFDESGKTLGSFGHHGDGSGDLAMPKGLAVDSDGAIYVVDGIFDNVQLFDRRGSFLLTLGRRGIDFGEFWLPSGVFIDENDELYVCDTYNRRIQVFRITEHYAETAS